MTFCIDMRPAVESFANPESGTVAAERLTECADPVNIPVLDQAAPKELFEQLIENCITGRRASTVAFS